MLSSHVIFTCYLHMLSSHVIFTCYLHMLSSHVIFTCYIHILCQCSNNFNYVNFAVRRVFNKLTYPLKARTAEYMSNPARPTYSNVYLSDAVLTNNFTSMQNLGLHKRLNFNWLSYYRPNFVGTSPTPKSNSRKCLSLPVQPATTMTVNDLAHFIHCVGYMLGVASSSGAHLVPCES